MKHGRIQSSGIVYRHDVVSIPCVKVRIEFVGGYQKPVRELSTGVVNTSMIGTCQLGQRLPKHLPTLFETMLCA